MALQAVRATGDFFTNADGSEFHYVGLSEFGLWKRWNMHNGPEALVRPILQQRREVADSAGYHGPIVLRVFRYSHPNNPFGVLPYEQDFSQIDAFLAMCAEYGCYVDWTCGDSQFDFMLPQPGQQQEHLDRFTSNVHLFCFMETCNEPFKNGWLPQNGVKAAPSPYYLRDSGNYVYISDTQDWERQYDLDFISFHGDRTNDHSRWPKWVCDLDDSIATLRKRVGKPSVLKEPNKFGPYYSDPVLAKLLGQRASMGGVVFHSQIGLQTDGYDDATRLAAFNFWTGVSGVLR